MLSEPSLCPAFFPPFLSFLANKYIMYTGRVKTATSRNRPSSRANSAARGAARWHTGITGMSTHTASGSSGIHQGVISRLTRTGTRGR